MKFQTPATHEVEKRITTAAAQAALCGLSLDVISPKPGDTAFVLSNWAQARRFEKLEQVEAWLQHHAHHQSMTQRAQLTRIEVCA